MSANDSVPFDLGPLKEWMDANLDVGKDLPIEASYVTGGASNELYAIRRGDQRFALRRPPVPAPDGRNATMLREYRLLSALSMTDVPHPKVFGACDDEKVIGSCFYLMEFVDGFSPIQEGTTWPEPFGSNLSLRRELGFQLVDGIARLANVDWEAVGLQGFGKPENFHERQVDRWLAHLSHFSFRPIDGLDTAATWLRSHRPKQYRPGIMHGDYQFANVMFCHGAPAKLAAIVDWEMATVGDPLLDLGWVINGWPNGDEAPSTSYVDYEGMPTATELLSSYEEISGRSVEEIDYYVILARFKLAVVLEGGYARAMQTGNEGSPMMQFGPIVLDMAKKAAELAATTDLS